MKVYCLMHGDRELESVHSTLDGARRYAEDQIGNAKFWWDSEWRYCYPSSTTCRFRIEEQEVKE